MKHLKRLTAAVSAAALTLTALPLTTSIVSDAADEYSVRDPFFNFSSQYNYYESEHFQFIWGNTGPDSSRVTKEFLEGNVKNLEAIWDVYMNELSNRPPCESVETYLQDGKKYKTNFYLSGTGLAGMQDDWAYMSWDSGGFAYMFCCVDSMKVDPPSWVLPHEFGHVMTAHQLGWNNNKYSYAWWEAIANWYREQYLYSDYSTDETGHGTDFFQTYMLNLCFTFPCGRDYYASWPFLQYLTENPDNLEGYGKDFVKKMLQEGQVDEYPFDQVERLAPADFKETLGKYAARMAGLDFAHGDAYRARLSEMLAEQEWYWQQVYTMLQPVAGKENTYTVPTERAPQFAGLNIVPLEVSGGTITASLEGLSGKEGADWRACIVQQADDGSCTYSDLFSAGQEVSVPYTGGKAYLSVIATPDLDTIEKYGLPGIYDNNALFSEKNVPFNSKSRYPYSVKFSDNVSITQRKVSTENKNWWENATYSAHPNGGGLVASTAKVDASVYVAPGAVVKGDATVTGNVKLLDHAVVCGSAKVSGDVVVSGYGMIGENATVSGNARVDDFGIVCGRANVSGYAQVIESACVYGNTTMQDKSVAKGVAFTMANTKFSGQGVGDGDLYSDNDISFTQGVTAGWTSAQAYASSRPFTKDLILAYDFDQDSTFTASDRYSSTYAVNSGAKWEAQRTSANGVLTFDGSSWLDFDRSALYDTDDFEIQLSFLTREGSDRVQELLHIGNDLDHIDMYVSGSDIEVVKEGSPVSAKGVITPGEWTKVRFIVEGDTATLMVNGQTVATEAWTDNDRNILEKLALGDQTSAYRIGADENGENGLNGSVDFVRFFSAKAEEPAEVYTEKEEVQQTTEPTTEPPTDPPTEPGLTPDWGNANCDGNVNLNDAVAILQYAALKEKYPLTEQGLVNADIVDNGSSGVNGMDALAIQMIDAELLKIGELPTTKSYMDQQMK
ncbi:MAG: hypothetical protein II762_06705 [Ruminococcus sp.]|nr:hypothetical protein [Ruminococcus sp.]